MDSRSQAGAHSHGPMPSPQSYPFYEDIDDGVLDQLESSVEVEEFNTLGAGSTAELETFTGPADGPADWPAHGAADSAANNADNTGGAGAPSAVLTPSGIMTGMIPGATSGTVPGTQTGQTPYSYEELEQMDFNDEDSFDEEAFIQYLDQTLPPCPTSAYDDEDEAIYGGEAPSSTGF